MAELKEITDRQFLFLQWACKNKMHSYNSTLDANHSDIERHVVDSVVRNKQYHMSSDETSITSQQILLNKIRDLYMDEFLSIK